VTSTIGIYKKYKKNNFPPIFKKGTKMVPTHFSVHKQAIT